MLNVRPASLGDKGLATPVDIAATAKSHDLSVKVTALYLHRAVFREDGAAPFGLEQTVTAAKPTSRTFEINGPLTVRWSGRQPCLSSAPTVS